jgi:hypothetical protein
MLHQLAELDTLYIPLDSVYCIQYNRGLPSYWQLPKMPDLKRTRRESAPFTIQLWLFLFI